MVHPLGDVESIGVHERGRLARLGIHNTRDLIDKAGTADGLDRVARLSGVDRDTLAAWVQTAELLHLPDLGRLEVRLLSRCGITGLDGILEAEPSALASRLHEANLESPEMLHAPHVAQVRRWVDAASREAAS